MSLLSFQTTVTGDVAVIHLSGELDVAGSALLEQELDRVTVDHHPRAIVLDFSGLEFMDSTGLRLVVLADARCREHDVRLALVPGPEPVHRVFEITRMADRLDFVTTPEEA